MRGDDTPISQRIPQQLKVRLLEKTLRGALRVRAISDDNIKLILAVLEELEAVTNVDAHVRVLEANAHTREVLLGDADDSLVDVAEDSLLDRLVLDDFAEDTAVAAADDKDFLGVGVGVHGEVGDHFLVPALYQHSAFQTYAGTRRGNARELITLSALDDIVEHKDGAVIAALEDKNILVLGFLVVQDLVDLEVHGLAGPHAGLFGEPAIYSLSAFSLLE